MGYIPLILILAAVVVLFIMVVHTSIQSKKKSMLQFQDFLLNGLEKFGNKTKTAPELNKETLKIIETEYKKTKAAIASESLKEFESLTKTPYQSLKLTIAQYNKLIRQKPYSFVASLMGHKPI
ncbi:hypothetical protein SAMN00777080_2817 [Aquiflexum balticum DSM 16537]|uniref:LemA protein n=1 Tax=Aquiflexum balticum DSM 16537 TaxID=758820 RepID=A0A1W2H5Q9_9BACT|nr:hypothetical protein [Aquiflexum balticum]SMD44199.1 hypothetical protein SAMN00777080_2817 [Aquiflexum balticum DSM 16537]